MSWEVEIERARALLASITRDRHLPAQKVAKAYEAWARDDPSLPFAHYLIENGHLEAVHVRLQLRRLAVKGLVLPDQHTYERFEDLLLCQLAIDAEILTPKLVHSVRKVQDKKIKEGKLRRLKDLLPRAGVDPSLLAVCVQHLRQRILVCRGCLGRYPRKGMGPIRLECPRCTYVIERTSNQLGGSGEFELTPAYTRMKLEESQEKILRTIPVAERAGSRAKHGAVPPQVVVAAVAILVLVLGAGIALLRSSGAEPQGVRPVISRTSAPESGVSDSGDDDQAEPINLSRIRLERHALLEAGDYEGLAKLWRGVDPEQESNPAGVHTQRDERLAELERLVGLAKQVQSALDAARSAPRDAARERLLASLAAQARTDTPPFGEAAGELRQRRAARRKQLAVAAKTRVSEARRSPPPDVQFWARHGDWVEESRPTVAVRVDGAPATARLLGVDEGGFVLEDGGSPRHHPWDEDPGLSLAVAEQLPGEEPVDLLFRLRFALLARAPAAAEAAAAALGLATRQLDTAALIGSAPLSSLPVEGPQGLPQVRYPMAWVPHDLTPVRETELWAGVGELYLEGDPAEIETRALPVTASDRLVIGCELEPGSATELGFGFSVEGEGKARSYRVRWRRKEWSLELDLGGGWNRLRSGSLRAMAREARLELKGGRLVVFLDGVQVGKASLGAGYERVKLVVFSRGGRVTVRDLTLAAPLDRPWLRAREEVYQRHVELALLSARGDAKRAQQPRLTELSVDDPQGRAVAERGEAERLDQAVAALAEGSLDDARKLLQTISSRLPAAGYYRAYLACLDGDPAGAAGILREILDEDGGFSAARALLAMAEARCGRLELATQEATQALDEREDLALGWLALARVGVFERDATRASELADLRPEFDMPWALAPGDPLVERELRVLDLLDLYARWCPIVSEERGFVVWSTEAVDTVRLKRLHAQLAAALRLKPARAQLVVVLGPSDYGLLCGPQAPPAQWDAETGALLCRTPLDLVDRQAVRAVAESYLVRAVGRGPAWLEAGLVEDLATGLSGQAPPGATSALERSPTWSQDQWLTLLRADREQLSQDPLARAKAWFLVGSRDADDHLKQVFKGVMEQLERGESVDLTPFSALDLRELEGRLR